jgi:ankyrin repeat protein
MADLPERPDLDQLRHQAKDLVRAARAGDDAAVARLRAVSESSTLAAAQLAVARTYGFASWPKLKREVERRAILNGRDLGSLRKLLVDDPSMASAPMEHWCDHQLGVAPLNYIAMLRFDADRLRLEGDLPGTGDVARALLAAGAPVDGRPDDPETPLITAASYGDAEVARVLIEAGADIDALAADDSGGVPGGSALLHAAVFGMTAVVDVLVAAGARIRGIEEAAAAGDIDGWLTPDTDPQARIRSLVMAADHQRLDVIDQLVAAGTPIDAVDEAFDGHPLRAAATNARPASVRHLLSLGADPHLRDDRGRTALDLCRRPHPSRDHARHLEVEAMLEAAM